MGCQMRHRKYDICRECGATLDYGEKCDCKKNENPIIREMIKEAMEHVKEEQK